jgi:protease I
MRLITTLLTALILLCLGASPSMAQYYDGYGDGYYDGYEEGYTCWMCPYCGFAIPLDVQVDESATEYQTTLGQVMVINLYDLSNYCPYCGTYGAYFVLVPCSAYYEDGEEDGDYGYEDGDYYEEDETGEDYEDECEEEYVDDDEDDAEVVEEDHEVEECEEAEYVETDDESEEEADGSGDNETEAAASEPVTGDEETANVTAPASTETPIGEAGKILIVVPSKDFNDFEFNATKFVFLDEGFEVDVASKGTEEALRMDGTAVAVDLEVSDAEVSDYEAIVFIGGPGVDDLLLYEDPDYVNLAGSTRDQDVLVGAICVAPKILANAWLLGGRKATVFPDSESIAYIESKGANYSDEQVVRDGNIITASGPEASEAFAEAVVAVKEDQA